MAGVRSLFLEMLDSVATALFTVVDTRVGPLSCGAIVRIANGANESEGIRRLPEQSLCFSCGAD